MGCDIHTFAEVRKDGKWQKVGEHFINDKFEREFSKQEKSDSPFDWRSYGMFGFLAGVRNYSESEVLVEPRGLPEDSEYLNEKHKDHWGHFYTRRQELEERYYHSMSYITLKELLDFDYDTTFWDRRCTRKEGHCINGAARARIHPSVPFIGEGEITTYREFLGEQFFRQIGELMALGKPEDVRVVFYFDN